MSIKNAKDPRWGDKEHTIIDLTVTFGEDTTEHPFSANPRDPLPHGKEIFDRALAGEFGPIGEYVAPVLPYTPITAPLWGFRAVLRQDGLFDVIDADIESQKTANGALWEAWNMGNSVSSISIITKFLIASHGQTQETIDSMLKRAKSL